MGAPVVHFEIVGRDGDLLKRYYSELFGWEIDSNNPMGYGTISRESNVAPDGSGIGGGIFGSTEGDYPGHVTFYVAVEDCEAALAKAEELGGKRLMGPDEVFEGLVIGQFQDPEGHMIGVLTAGRAA